MGKHFFSKAANVRIAKDLSGKSPEMVGKDATVLELLETKSKHPQYKVLIFGEGAVKGGVFEADERELAIR